MTSAQTRLDNAILDHEHAESEVERLCDIVERAADALKKARQAKRAAQKELDKAAKAAATSPRRAIVKGHSQQHRQVGAATPEARDNSSPRLSAARPRYSDRVDQGGGARRASNAPSGQEYGHEEVEQYTEEPQSDYSDEDSEESLESLESDKEDDDEEEEDGFDMGNEALEQVRYRLEVAKIDPNSPDGTKILDELLVRLNNVKMDVIDAQLVNEFIDDLLFETEEQEATSPQNSTKGVAEQNGRKPPPPPQDPQQHPRTKINRGGKVLGMYQGELDGRGYARHGSGSMYYDGGHECHGTWQHDEMVGRGTYQWSDGHIYDGEWLNGKRHGLGRFIRPDNVVLYGRYEKGHHKGEGVRWSANKREAQMVEDGVPRKTVSLSVAKKIASDLGFDDVLPPV